MLELERFTYRYPDAPAPALDGVSLAVEEGSFVVLAGTSGCGKSTLLRAACGLVPHFHGGEAAGELRVGGLSLREHGPSELAAVCGTVFQDPESQVVMGGVRAEIALPLEHRGEPAGAVARGVEEAALALGIGHLLDRRTDTLSGGELQRVAIAAALAPRPRLLLLDEPTVGLDPQTRKAIWNYLRELREAEDITVFMTTHYMEEAEHCDRIAIIDRGVLIALDTPAALKAGVGEDRVVIHTGDHETVVTALRKRFDIEAEAHEDVVTFTVPDGEAFIPRLFSEGGLPIDSIEMARPSLDDVFIKRTGFSLRDAESSGRPAGDEPLRMMGRR